MWLLRENVVERARGRVVGLTEDEYLATLADASERGLSGGVVYDALIARAAAKAKARILTFNARHFRRVCRNPDRDLIDP